MARRAQGEPWLSPLTVLALIRWAALVAGVLLVSVAIGYSLSGQWRVGLVLVMAGGALLSLPLRRRRMAASAHAAREWPPARVGWALAAAGAMQAPLVDQVRVLRRLDPRLGLSDALELVKRAAAVDPAER